LSSIRISGAWYYPRGESTQTVSYTIKQLGLKFVVVSAGAQNLDEPAAFQQTLELFKGIQSMGARPIVMTLQGPNYAYMANLQKAIELIDNSIRLCNAVESCNEIHLDIEPHTLDEWKSGTDEQNQAILDEMTSVIKSVNDHIRTESKGEITLSAAITWWMLSSANLTLRLDPAVKVYIMSYGGVGSSATEILRMVSKKDQSGTRGERYQVGIGIKEFDDSVKGALVAAQTIEQTLVKDPLFEGVCFYSLNIAAGEDN